MGAGWGHRAVISRRRLLKGAAAGLIYAQPKIANAGMFSTQARIASPYQAKRTTLMLIGASVAWGDGLDQTETYAAAMQAQIDSRLSTPLGGWVARCVTSDDWMSGYASLAAGDQYVYPATPSNGAPLAVPLNGTSSVPGYGTGDGNQNTGFAASPAVGPFMNPTVPPAYTVQGSGKLNVDTVGGALPTTFNGGIFYNYGGTVFSGFCYPLACGPSIRLQSSGQNIRFAANAPTFIFLGMIGTGSVSIFGSSNLGLFLGTTLSNTGSSGITIRSVTCVPTGNAPQSFAVNWLSGTVDIAVLWPTRTQATTGISVQVCARNSYSIQDYIGNSPFSGKTEPITGLPITTLIKQAVINQVSNGFSSPPIYLVFDSYNTMVQSGRILDPTTYATALSAFGLALAPTSADGRIILSMPFVEPSTGDPQWPNASNYYPSEYRKAILNLAIANRWDVIDESVLPSYTMYSDTASQSFLYRDKLHPTSTIGAAQLGRLYIGALGL